MASVLAGITPPGRVDLARDLLGGQQARQSVLAGQQQLQQGQMQLDRAPQVAAQQDAAAAQQQQMGEQQIGENDFMMAVQRGRIINRLARQVREMPEGQRGQFVQSLNPEMLESVGIDPAMIQGVGLDDQSLDAIIAQTGAALQEVDGGGGSKFGQVNPRDFTPESLAKYQQSGNFEDLVREREFSQGGARFATGRDGGVAPLVGDVQALSLADLQAEVERRTSFGSTRGQEEAREQFQVPAGYRRTEEGMEPISGSPADQALQASIRERQEGMEITQRAARTVVDDTQRALDILDKSGGWAAGAGSYLSALPGTPARTMQKHIDSIKGNVGIDSLLSIKRSGAGLGAIPQAQLEMLASLMGNLDTAQSPEELRYNLTRIEEIYSDIVEKSGGDPKTIAQDRERRASGEPAQGGSRRLRFDAQGNMIE